MLGQQIKKNVTLNSEKNPASNRTYTEEETVYDSFGNCLSTTDEDGLVTKTSYDPETGDEKETIEAVGTEYESKDKGYVSTDALKTMMLDEYGRTAIDIQDAFGNTIISKDEASGTWTESVYEYGTETGGQERRTGLKSEEEKMIVCWRKGHIHSSPMKRNLLLMKTAKRFLIFILRAEETKS